MDENNNKEPGQEITSWYIPHRNQQPEEVVACYVQERMLPEKARNPSEQKKKQSKKGLWIFLITMALLAIAVVATILFFPEDTVSAVPGLEKEGDASSIADILYTEKSTTIPRADTADGVTMHLLGKGTPLTPQEVYKKASGPAVIVLAESGESTHIGTGVILTEDGYVITNAHVISGGESAGIVLYGSYLFDAELVGFDTEADIAVLKALDARGLPAAEFCNSDECQVGDAVYAIGNPLSLELKGTFTEGMISGINRNVKIDGHTVNTIQTTAALNNGNSGGPLLNDAGQVIGINTLKMTNSGMTDVDMAPVEGLGFALPICDVFFVVNDILANGEYRGAPSFGMTVTNVGDISNTMIEVVSVENGGGAFNADIREGDIILAADGVEVHSVAELQSIRREHKILDKVVLTILRDGEKLDLLVTMYSNRR